MQIKKVLTISNQQ